MYHVTAGDSSSAATFHKTLPHDELGQVKTITPHAPADSLLKQPLWG